jgi:hypothetical protein
MALQKTNIPGYMKDNRSRVIVNTNNDELSEYKANKEKIKRDKEIQNKILVLEKYIDSLKERIERLEDRCQ